VIGIRGARELTADLDGDWPNSRHLVDGPDRKGKGRFGERAIVTELARIPSGLRQSSFADANLGNQRITY
jgi:hypothetical protein